MQRNLRPPVLTSMKCIGLRHFGHGGGGGFLGIGGSPGQAGAQHSQSPITAEAGAVMTDGMPGIGRCRSKTEQNWPAIISHPGHGRIMAREAPPAVIPSEHSTRLIALGYMADVAGRLRMTTPRIRIAAGPIAS
jgi:hypothetical protein